MTVTLHTERLILRQWQRSDFEPMAAFYANEEMTRYTGGPSNLWRTWQRFCERIGEWQMRGYGTFAIEERSCNRFAGYVGLWHPIDLEEPELCWSLLSPFHGKGYATEAARRVQIWAHKELKLAPLMSFVHHENIASQKVATRLGATCLGDCEMRGDPHLFYRHSVPQTET